MFTVMWDSIDAFADAAGVECEQVFDTLGEACSAAEELDEDQWAMGIVVWDNDRREEVPWPW